MFPGVATSVTWGHISRTAIAPALKFPKFLSVQCTADNSAKPWSYPCRCCDENTCHSPALEIPLSDYPQLFFPIHHHGFAASFASGNLSPQTQLTSLTENRATANFLHEQFCSSTRYDQPFSSDPNQCFCLWLASAFYLTLIYLCSQIDRSFLTLFKEIRFAPLLCRMSTKSEESSLNKIQTLCFCRPFPMPEARSAQAPLAWSSLFLSPSDSSCSCQAPAPGGLRHPWISFQPLQAGGQVLGGSRCGAVPASRHPCPSWGAVSRATPGMYLILHLCAFELHRVKPCSSF